MAINGTEPANDLKKERYTQMVVSVKQPTNGVKNYQKIYNKLTPL